ncbi:hypothetical protein BJX62DRAFT_220455 [Aspergillus germanicus]
MYSGSGPVEPNGKCHSSSNPVSHPSLTMISSMPPPPGFAIPPTYFSQVPIVAQPQPQAGVLVAGPSPPQALQQIQGLPQPIPSALQQWISQTIQQEFQQQLSLLIQGAQGAQAATLQRRIYELEQEVKRLGQEKQ